jgi:murein L,D-transpeptidase YcbB/YkuD
MFLLGTAVAASLLGTSPALARKKPKPVPVMVAPPVVIETEPVARFYQLRYYNPIWFRGANSVEAVTTLAAALRRAPIDGLANGPQLAADVETAAARARTDPAAVKAAELVLSRAWVAYAATVRAPTPGMIYGDPSVRSTAPRPDEILRAAVAAPSLAAHVKAVSDVNPIYAALRDEAEREALLPGGGNSAKLLANLPRARAIPATGRFVLVDAATARLWMYEEGRPVDSMKVVVGKLIYPTPMIASMIHYATFNPYWHVPDHLVAQVVAPGVIRGGEAYLKARGYEVLADWSGETAVSAKDIDWKSVAAGETHVKVRQKPGGANSMGKVKFPFPNQEGIYLHDTPMREYFAKAKRDLSNGCIRVEDAQRLASWLFGHQPAALTSKAPEQHVALGRGVPVFVTYLTAQPSDGKMTFTDDIYGLDRLAGSQSAAIR